MNSLDRKRTIAVDLDGTLIKTDILHESLILYLKGNPLRLFLIISWLLKGIKHTKCMLSENVRLDISSLPYNQRLIDWLRIQKKEGNELILVSGAHESLCKQVSMHLGLFDKYFGTNSEVNLIRANKRDLLNKKFTHNGFDYIGNSFNDLKIWESATNSYVVNGGFFLMSKLKLSDVKKLFDEPRLNIFSWLKLVRIHQWVKNLLIFVAFFAAQEPLTMQIITTLFLGFLSISLLASCSYIFNDLLDLEYDRVHKSKKKRPLASGDISILQGIVTAILLLFVSLSINIFLPYEFFLCYLAYLFLITVYSLRVKRLLLIDCFLLSILYSIRIISGAFLVDVSISFWFIVFSLLIFSSLAFLKRYNEITSQKIESHSDELPGRAYVRSDRGIILNFGISSGYLSGYVLTRYITSPEVLILYSEPRFLWITILIFMYWVTYVWMKAHRKEMDDDPILFTIKDNVSRFLIILAVIFIFMGNSY